MSLVERVRAGIDWGRPGPWPPDAVTALEELAAELDRLRLVTEQSPSARARRYYLERAAASQKHARG